MRILILVIMFLLIGAFFIVSNNNLHLANSEDFGRFYGLCFKWFSGLYDNGKSITGYIAKSDWLPSR